MRRKFTRLWHFRIGGDNTLRTKIRHCDSQTRVLALGRACATVLIVLFERYRQGIHVGNALEQAQNTPCFRLTAKVKKAGVHPANFPFTYWKRVLLLDLQLNAVTECKSASSCGSSGQELKGRASMESEKRDRCEGARVSCIAWQARSSPCW